MSNDLRADEQQTTTLASPATAYKDTVRPNAKHLDSQFTMVGDADPPMLPLLFVVTGCFVVPLGAMRVLLSHGVADTGIARILPSISKTLQSWNGRDVLPESAYLALIADLWEEGLAKKTCANAAARYGGARDCARI